MNPLVVVFGATGATGVPLVRSLVAEGRRVRAVVRHPEVARARIGEALDRCEVALADAADRAAVDRAMAGADRVYCAIGGPTGTPELAAVERGLVDAAARAGVGRYVKVSGIDAPDRRCVIQSVHAGVEDHLRASGLPHVILRPSFFLQNLLGLAPAVAQGVLPVPAGRGGCALVDARDLAAAAHRALLDDGHEGRVYTLTGPEVVDHDQVAAAIAEVAGHPVRYLDVPPAAFAESLVGAGLPGWFAGWLSEVFAAVLAPGNAAYATGDVALLTGRPATPMAAFLRDHAAAFRA